VAEYVRIFVDVLFNVLIIAILLDALISWFPISPSSPIVRLLDDITEPILAPLRQVVPRLGMFDITPIVAMFILEILQNIIDSGLSGYT
jgi:YggT family protein